MTDREPSESAEAAAIERAAPPPDHRAASIGPARRFPVFYDPPAETIRMGLILLTCLVFSIVGLVLASRAHTEPGTQRQREKLRAAAIALAGGFFCIYMVTVRYRPGGSHARGIVLELTDDELRLWGRGYGTRVAFANVARVRYRMVDTYLGRLGAMRQLRITVEGQGRQIEVAREALVTDRARGLKAEGGEGDCIVLDPDDFDAFEKVLLAKLPPEK